MERRAETVKDDERMKRRWRWRRRRRKAGPRATALTRGEKSMRAIDRESGQTPGEGEGGEGGVPGGGEWRKAGRQACPLPSVVTNGDYVTDWHNDICT